MEDFKVRLQMEVTELYTKIEKLKIFMLSDRYNNLPEIDRKDLSEQLFHMSEYYEILLRRISRLCN